MTCKLEGAWPLIDNEFLTVQVTKFASVCQLQSRHCHSEGHGGDKRSRRRQAGQLLRLKGSCVLQRRDGLSPLNLC
ncbi:hypothetical protein EB796_007963 [Bugula neritina]|uniref:Repulsive guidance molecule C-terminal domain-containing protein n=1 Tax=Bugula neritina TaxID=10212 RepID=A0A7J7K712_BUGNE|nr:hypothetical protein EB796_007963 [Bugula neritina]